MINITSQKNKSNKIFSHQPFIDCFVKNSCSNPSLVASFNKPSCSMLLCLLLSCSSLCWLNDEWSVDFILYVAGVLIRGQSFCFNNNNSPQKKTRYNCTSSHCILKPIFLRVNNNLTDIPKVIWYSRNSIFAVKKTTIC